MKTFFKLFVIVLVALSGIFSCTKTYDLIDDVNYDLVVNYPASAAPGTPTTVSLGFLGKPSFPATVRWFADNSDFPLYLKKSEIVNAEEEIDYTFIFPYLMDGDYYYIRCSVIMPEDMNASGQLGNTQEKIIRIMCKR